MRATLGYFLILFLNLVSVSAILGQHLGGLELGNSSLSSYEEREEYLYGDPSQDYGKQQCTKVG